MHTFLIFFFMAAVEGDGNPDFKCSHNWVMSFNRDSKCSRLYNLDYVLETGKNYLMHFCCSNFKSNFYIVVPV